MAFQIKHTEQNVLNTSFDDVYEQSAVEILAEDGDAEVLRRLQADSDGNLKISSGGSLGELIDTLHELTNRLAPLAAAVANTAQLRVIQASVPSTAVTGPITNAQYVATRALGGIHYTMRTSNENLTAVLANINNCTGA